MSQFSNISDSVVETAKYATQMFPPESTTIYESDSALADQVKKTLLLKYLCYLSTFLQSNATIQLSSGEDNDGSDASWNPTNEPSTSTATIRQKRRSVPSDIPKLVFSQLQQPQH